MMDFEEGRKLLIDELSREKSDSKPFSFNILKVRDVCRKYPGIIASSGLRLQIWSLLLLGKVLDGTESSENIPSPKMTCMEQQVGINDLYMTSKFTIFLSIRFLKLTF